MTLSLSLAVGAAALIGCTDGPSGNDASSRSAEAASREDAHEDHGDHSHEHGDHDHSGHSHPTEGPHHGDLVELGNEEFHAEIVHGDGTVTVYILDSGAHETVAIESDAITINVRHDGKPEQFQLAASPDAGDPEGRSCRFVSNDAELAEHLDDQSAEPRLVLTINGKSYRGVISHSHDHDHDHDHDDHDHDDHDHDDHDHDDHDHDDHDH